MRNPFCESDDNPNVWYELGYAFALRKPVAMICSDERSGKFPFDIQHRTVITYRTGSAGGFAELGTKITNRLKSFIGRQESPRPQFVAALDTKQEEAGRKADRLSEKEETVLKLLFNGPRCLEDIAEALGEASVGNVQFLLDQLKAKHLIEMDIPTTMRSKQVRPRRLGPQPARLRITRYGYFEVTQQGRAYVVTKLSEASDR
jgi:hypothetical protein